jgi:tetratricopeptide (TPR) repeat protein
MMYGTRLGPRLGGVVVVLGLLIGSAIPARAAEDGDWAKDRIRALNQLTGSDPVDEEFKTLMKDRKEAKKLLAAARAMVKEKSQPLTYNTALILANVASRLKDQSTAEACYRLCIDKATKLKSGRLLWRAYLGLIAMYYDNQKYAASARVCKEFVDINWEDAKPTVYLLASNKEDDDGEPAFLEGIGYNPARRYQSEALELLIQSKAKQGKVDEALKAVNNLLTKDPDDLDSIQLKGWVLREAGRLRQAARVYEDFIERITNDKRLKKKEKAPVIEKSRYTLSNIYADLKQIDKATDHLKALLEKEPDNPTYNNDLGYIWADNDRNLEEAEKLIRKALDEDRKLRKKAKVTAEEDRDNGAYLDSLGWVLYKQKKYQAAKEALLKAVEDEDNQHIEIYDHLGDVYKALGENSKAVEAWRKGLKHVTGSKRDKERKATVEKKIKALK